MPKKTKIIILIIAGLVIIGLFVFIMYYNTNDSTNDLSNNKKQDNKKQGEETSLGDVQKIVKSVPRRDVNYCDRYDGEKKDLCISTVANTNNDSKICELIKDQDLKNKCKELIIFNKIINDKKIEECFTLIYFKKTCFDDFFWQWDNLDRCASFKDEIKDSCEDIINHKLALSNNDSDYCQKIKYEALKLDCIASIINKPKDSDNDGLTDESEMAYGTNPFKKDTDNDGLTDLEELSKFFTDPNNPDSDGDGYLDGDEINRGYNPRGEGKL